MEGTKNRNHAVTSKSGSSVSYTDDKQLIRSVYSCICWEFIIHASNLQNWVGWWIVPSTSCQINGVVRCE